MSSPLLERLRSDETLRPFLSEDFDETILARSLLNLEGEGYPVTMNAASIQETLQKLGSSISETEQSIGRLVSENQSSLLGTITGTMSMRRSLEPFARELSQARSQLEGLIGVLAGPYDSLGARLRTLEHLQESIQLLRSASRVLTSLRKLGSAPEGAAGGKELIKSSLALQEIEQATREADLSGLRVVERALSQSRVQRLRVEAQADAFFAESLSSAQQMGMASSIQVYFNLGVLAPRLSAWTSRAGSEVEARLSRLGAGSLEAYWPLFQEALDWAYQSCFQATTIQKILLKRRDPSTKKNLVDALQFPFITLFAERLETALGALRRSPPAVLQRTVQEYPRILEAINALYSRLVHAGSNVTSSYTFWRKETFQRPFQEFEVQYKALPPRSPAH